MKSHASSFDDFKCAHCHNIVSAAHMLSGVNNRNHCPYCLWSCHLDLFAAGDRLSACKGEMKPRGLTLKKSRNKYRLESGGELMLIHECVDCQSLSINRIAADDDPDSVMEVFAKSIVGGYQIRTKCERDGIVMLGMENTKVVFSQLYGSNIGYGEYKTSRTG